jgi:cytochrome c oxidase cbb3-type subunit 3
MRSLPALLAALLALSGCARGGESPREAAELYRRQCARCHGPDGKGDRRTIAVNANVDLTGSVNVQRGNRGQIRRRIAEGYGPMPAFASKLDAREIELLTAYTIQLAQRK